MYFTRVNTARSVMVYCNIFIFSLNLSSRADLTIFVISVQLAADLLYSIKLDHVASERYYYLVMEKDKI